MGDIIIETPQGNDQIEIEGDAPNEKEKKAIMDKFFSQPSVQPEAQSLDLANASVEEIQDYARQKRLSGIDPLTNEQITDEEFERTYKEPGVDYSTGLDSIGSFSRFGYGRMDTDEERAGYLREKVGEDGFRQDALGRFILTKKGRQTLGMGKGKELAIDEEGLSFNDIKDFAGATAAPIGAAIGASLMASGIGFIPGVALVGAAGFAGKALDEAVEYSQGLQKQSFGDVLRDSAFEGAFALAGEGVGRGISSFFGRLIKGPGGPENEALRAQARKLVNQGFRPTVAGATDESFRPILNRLQSIYEGVFPQKVAAQQNLKLALQELENVRGVNKQSIKDLNDSIMKDIDQAYANTNQKFEMAQKNISKDTEAIVSKIMSKLKDDQNVPKKLADKLTLSKNVFDRDMDALYSGINDTLQGQKIVNTSPIIEALDELAKTAPLDIKSTKFYKDIKALDGEKATVLEMNRIRTQLSQASYSPEVFGGATSNSLGRMKKVVEQSLRDAEVDLTLIASKQPGSQIFTSLDDTKFFGKALETVDVQTALRNLRRANRLYGVGMGRFDKVVNENLLKEARRGTLNPNYIFNEIITKDNPDAVRQVLAAVRGLPTTMKKIDFQKGKAFIESQKIGTKTIDEALESVKDLPANSPARLEVERDVLKIQRNAEELAQVRGTGAEVAEDLRQNLGRMFLKEQLDKSKVIDKITGQEVFDGVKLANNLSSLGSTAKVLFKKELNEIDDVVQTLKRSNANLSDNTATALEGKPLFDSLKELKQATKAKADLEKDDLINSLQRSGGDPEKIAQVVFKTPESINVAKTNLTPQTFNAVQDAAMGKLLKDIGAAVDDVGRPRLTPDFEDAFKSGALGTKLKNVLTNYGDDTINAMFGKGTSKTLNTLADDMVKVSNAATVGKGGLAAPTIALSLTLFGLVTAPLATIPTALGFAFMSKMLRNPTVLKIMMASRKPGADKLGQLFQIAQTTAAQLEAQGARGLTEQTAEEVKPVTGEVAKQLAPQISQMKTDLTSQITPPSAASSASGVSPLGTNPIVNPNPATQALAQALQGKI